MAADDAASGVPNVGSHIALISKSLIRYTGVLYTINMADSTIALQNVKSHGTEDRPAAQYISPQAETYDYIVFRGSDIQELTVTQHAPPPQPAAAPGWAGAPAYPPQQPLPPPGAPPPSYPPQAPPVAQYQPPLPVGRPPGGPPPMQQPLPPQQQHPQPPPEPALAPSPQPPAAAAQPPPAAGPQPVPYAPAPSVTLNATGGGRLAPAQQQANGRAPQQAPASYVQAAGGTQGGRGGRGDGGPRGRGARGGRGRGGGGGPPGFGGGSGRGAGGGGGAQPPQQQANGAPRGAAPARPPAPVPVPVPQEDFDFEAALAKFEKADINKDADVKADAAADDKGAYKKDGFFDELSRETREGGPGRSWLSEQRKLDMETFGMVGGVRPLYGRGSRRGRGGGGRAGEGGREGRGRGGGRPSDGGRSRGRGGGRGRDAMPQPTAGTANSLPTEL